MIPASNSICYVKCCLFVFLAEDSQTGTIVRKSHKKNTEVQKEKVAETKAATQPIIVSEPDPIFSNGNTIEDDDDEDGDLGLKARALYDYQAGEVF